MHRFFVPPEHITGSMIHLDDSRQLRHIRTVLRLSVHDQVICFDGQGREYAGTILEQGATGLVVRIDRVQTPSQRRVNLWLAVGLLKADRFDWMVQKATELGVSRVSPLLTRHTVVRPSAGRQEKRGRWQRIAVEAAKQSRRATIPLIDPPRSFEAFLPLLHGHWMILMPTLAVTTVSLHEALTQRAPGMDVAVLIGPEGDFSREEVAQAQAYGAKPVSLGVLTLRSETAALATLAILQHVLGG